MPLEPEGLDKEYYNLGLKLFHAYKEIHYQSRLIELASSGEDSFWKEKGSFKDFKMIVEFSATSLLKIGEQYETYILFKKEFEKKHPKLIGILEDEIIFNIGYDICRNMYVKKILEKKEKFNQAYGNLLSTLKEVVSKK